MRIFKTSAFIAPFVFAGLFGSSCTSSVPIPKSQEQTSALRSFYVGLAAVEVGDDRRAAEELKKAVEFSPEEPAAWNNLGVLHLRQRDLENASRSLETAGNLAPDNSTIILNSSLVAGQTGNPDRSMELLNRAVDLDPTNLHARYLIAQEFERRANDADALSQYAKILSALPDNVGVAIETARLAAKTGKTDDLNASFAVIEKSSNKFPAAAIEQLAALKIALGSTDARQITTQISYLRNSLLSEQWFRNQLAEFKPSDTSIGTLIRRPLVIPSPEFKPAPPDTEITFEAKSVHNEKAASLGVFYFDGETPPVPIWSVENSIYIGTESIPGSAYSPDQIAIFDFDYDFKNDIAVANSTGLFIFRQTENRRFEDATAKTELPANIVSGDYSGVWRLDVEHDGDLDLLVAVRNGPVIVLQNNSDGSFAATSPFEGLTNVRDFAFADVDEDGDSDAVFLTDDGGLRISTNERGGEYAAAAQVNESGVRAMTVGDLNGDGIIDVVIKKGSEIFFLNLAKGAKTAETIKASVIKLDPCHEDCSIDVADIDNNSANDIVVKGNIGTTILLGNGVEFVEMPANIPGRINEVVDINGDGRLDLIGTSNGLPTVFENRGTKNYHWQIIRPRAAKTEGDQRVNSFGIGGEIEIRSGLHAQKQIIESPQVHFGLGEQATTDVLRIVWANGYVQAEFDIKGDQVIAAEQRLKGSCPHMFAWNGEKFAFVKDAPPWSPALGLKINAQDTYGVLQTEEWFKIPGDALRPLAGFYELRITGEYWETFYLDHYKLLAVDHPAETEIFTDERFAIPLPPLKVFSTQELKPFTSAVDHNGRDVSEKVAVLDEKYLDGIKRGRFQGVAEDHWVELEIPNGAPTDRKLWLVADGWLHPTDASINVQRGQGVSVPPRSLSIEVEQLDGTWKPVKENLGFPAGKMKTIMIDLDGIFPVSATARKFRLRTEMEIFWDRLAWAVDIPEPDRSEQAIDLASADLRYRGFSVIEKADDSSPEKPVYDQILTTSQRWRDLVGYYTRFGDVKELMKGVDGRMVLMNAGDELVLRFPALPDVKAGWKRDFVIIGNGWIKDGDLNSVFSKTLLPLPTHESNDYSRKPGRLADDPVYRKFRSDWLNYHTRYVGTEGFVNAARQSY